MRTNPALDVGEPERGVNFRQRVGVGPAPSVQPVPAVTTLMAFAGPMPCCGRRLPYSASVDSAATKASCGTDTEPMDFMRFLPAFCFSSSLRLREISPP